MARSLHVLLASEMPRQILLGSGAALLDLELVLARLVLPVEKYSLIQIVRTTIALLVLLADICMGLEGRSGMMICQGLC